MTDNGLLRSFNDFKEYVLKIDKTYNVNYLRAEYNYAIHSSMMVSRWEQFEAEAEFVPNIQYSAVLDGRTRDHHAILNGVVKPIANPFWNTYAPPLGCNCRCELIQTNDDISTHDINTPNIPDFFQNNPGKTKNVFDIDNHAYSKNVNKETVDLIKKTALSNITLKRSNKEIDDIKENRAVLKEWAKKNIVGKNFTTSDGIKLNKLTYNNIKSILSHNSINRIERDNLIYNLESVLENSIFDTISKEAKGDKNTKIWKYYIYEDKYKINIKVLNEKNNPHILYSIGDYIKKEK